MTPLKPIAPTTKVALGILFFVVFVAIWSLAMAGTGPRPKRRTMPRSPDGTDRSASSRSQFHR